MAQNKVSLRAINPIKENWSGKLKGRACTDGQPQRCYITKEDVSSPNISLKSLFISLVIDAHEGIYVKKIVPGSYPNPDVPEDKFILLNIEVEFMDIICEVNPNHKKDVRVENGVKVIYLPILKDLYGCM